MGGSGRGVAASGQWVISSDVVYEPEGSASRADGAPLTQP